MSKLTKSSDSQEREIRAWVPCTCYACECVGSGSGQYASYYVQLSNLGSQLSVIQNL